VSECKQLVFQLITPQRSYFLKAPTLELYNKWVAALSNSIALLNCVPESPRPTTPVHQEIALANLKPKRPRSKSANEVQHAINNDTNTPSESSDRINRKKDKILTRKKVRGTVTNQGD
jgi:hypothetical protein